MSAPIHRGARAACVALGLSIAITIALYAVPPLRFLAWPLLLLSTLAHELGHGLTAALLGGRFESLKLWPDASGVASYSGAFGRAATALIAAGGLLGPAIAAALLFHVGRRPRLARSGLGAIGLGLGLALFLVVRNPFGLAFVAVVAAIAVVIAANAPALAQTTIVVVATQLSLSVFSRADYLFTPIARTADGTAPSDVAQIASALLLPYWLWGAICGLISVAVLLAGIGHYLKST